MDTTTEEFDVRSVIPIKRHEKMVKLFNELPAGDSFIFINDHDLKPLYYQVGTKISEHQMKVVDDDAAGVEGEGDETGGRVI